MTILDDPLGFVNKVFADMGAPLDNILVSQTVAAKRGNDITGIAYFVPGKGQYVSEPEARQRMEANDRLYRIDVHRIE